MMFILCVASRVYGSNLSQTSILFRIPHICICVFVFDFFVPSTCLNTGTHGQNQNWKDLRFKILEIFTFTFLISCCKCINTR